MGMKVAISPDFFPVSFLISVVPSSLEFVAISKGKDKGILQMLYKLSNFSQRYQTKETLVLQYNAHLQTTTTK